MDQPGLLQHQGEGRAAGKVHVGWEEAGIPSGRQVGKKSPWAELRRDQIAEPS